MPNAGTVTEACNLHEEISPHNGWRREGSGSGSPPAEAMEGVGKNLKKKKNGIGKGKRNENRGSPRMMVTRTSARSNYVKKSGKKRGRGNESG